MAVPQVASWARRSAQLVRRGRAHDSCDRPGDRRRRPDRSQIPARSPQGPTAAFTPCLEAKMSQAPARSRTRLSETGLTRRRPPGSHHRGPGQPGRRRHRQAPINSTSPGRKTLGGPWRGRRGPTVLRAAAERPGDPHAFALPTAFIMQGCSTCAVAPPRRHAPAGQGRPQRPRAASWKLGTAMG